MTDNNPASTASQEVVHSIKGFDANLRCRGYQFEFGKSYTQDGDIVICENGFHAVEGYPLEVFRYYAPATSRYAETIQQGSCARHFEDSKIASATITIGVEIKLHDLIQRAIKWVFDRSTPEGPSATGVRGAASATGYQGAASATGYQGAASATGDQGAASATGVRGAASATGANSTAMASGYMGRAAVAEGGALYLAYRDPDTDKILHVWAGIAGRDGIEPDVFYRLNHLGAPEVASENE